MDPQQRLLLETSWEALEHAGIAPELAARQPTRRVRRHHVARLRSSSPGSNLERLDGYVGDGQRSAASRRAGSRYALGLQGPSMTVDTACSSSLVAMHLACQACARASASSRSPAARR